MNDLLKQDFPQADAHVRHIDIGRTGKWGKPRSSRNWDRFHAYPMAVWDTLGGTQPDVILIDGRFRLACFVATVMRLTGPATILFDDYDSRDRYHIAENYQKPDQMIDRMAIFRITPRPIAPTEFGWMIPAFFYVSFTKDSH